jgi:hypothetical protein
MSIKFPFRLCVFNVEMIMSEVVFRYTWWWEESRNFVTTDLFSSKISNFFYCISDYRSSIYSVNETSQGNEIDVILW